MLNTVNGNVNTGNYMGDREGQIKFSKVEWENDRTMQSK